MRLGPPGHKVTENRPQYKGSVVTGDQHTERLLPGSVLGKAQAGTTVRHCSMKSAPFLKIGTQFPLWLSGLVNMTIGCNGDFEL